MPVGYRVVDKLSNLADVVGDFQDGETIIREGAVWEDATPVSLPFTGVTDGNVDVPFELTHTLDNSDFASSSSNHPNFAPLRVTGNVLPTTTNITNAADLIYLGPRFQTVYGDESTAARGTAHSVTILYDLKNAAQTGSEHALQMGWIRAGDTIRQPVARMWLGDWSIHGPIGTAPALMNGETVFMGSYNSAQPSGGPRAAYWAVTRPGGGSGSELGHNNAQMYASEVGFGVAGFAGVPASSATRGWHTAFKAGGFGSGWMLPTDNSIIGVGLGATDVEEAGVKLWGPISSGGNQPRGIWFAGDQPGETWQWLLYFENGAANNPSAGALMLPGANSDAGQIKWGSDALAPHLFRSANYRLGLDGALRVQLPDSLVDPIAQFGLATDPDGHSILLQNNQNSLRTFVAPNSANQYLTGALAGDAGIAASTGGLLFGTSGTARGALRGSNWGFGTVSPSSPFHVTINARFQGQARFDGAVPGASANAGVYPGLATGVPRIRFGNGTSTQDWTVDNVTGDLVFYRDAMEKTRIGASALTLSSVGITQTGVGVTNSFGGNISVTGSTTLGTGTGLLKRTSGLVANAIAGTDYEAALGNPSVSGYLLSSTAAGVRSWVSAGSLAGSISHNSLLNLATGDPHTGLYAYQLPGDATRNTITSQAATAVPLNLVGHASQSAALLDIQSSGGNTLLRTMPDRSEIGGELRFLEPAGGGANFVALKAPALTSDLTWTWPSAEGTAGQVLTWNTGGLLTWADPAASGDISGAVALAPATSARNIVQPSAGTAIPLTLDGHASQSVELFRIRDSAGANLFRTLLGGHAEVAGTVRLVETGAGTEYVSIGAPASVTTSIDYKLPATITAGEFLTTDASGNLSWAAPSGDVSATAILAPGTLDRNLIQPGGDFHGLVLKEASGGQTEPLMEVREDDDTVRASVTAAGAAVFVSVNAAVTASSLTVGSLTGLLRADTGVVSAAAAGTDYEAPLGNPASDNYLLRSTAAGVRSWVDPATIAEPPLGNPASDGYALVSTAAGVRSWVNSDTFGAGTVDGTGTANTIPLWSDTDTLTDSVLKSVLGGISLNGSVVVGRDAAPQTDVVAEFYSTPGTPQAVLMPFLSGQSELDAISRQAGMVVWADHLGRFAGGTSLAWESVAWLSDVPDALSDLSGLDQDVLPNHAYLTGRPGGQSLIGGTQAGDVLSLIPTSHSSGGYLDMGLVRLDTINDRIGFKETGPLYDYDFGPGDMRVQSLPDGFVYSTGGVLGVAATPGGDSLWTDDTGNGVIHPGTTTRRVSIGSATQDVTSQMMLKGVTASEPLAVFKTHATPGDHLRFLNSAGTVLGAFASDGRYVFGASSPHASAAMEIASTTQGFLPPRMTTTQRDAISSPAAGLRIWNTTEGREEYHDGTDWYFLTGTLISGAGPTAVDTFNRADNSSTLGTSSGGQTWTAERGTWGISSNQGYCSNASATLNYATLAGVAGNGTYKITTATLQDLQFIPLRFVKGASVSADRLYLLQYLAGTPKWVFRFWDGGFNIDADITGFTPTAGDQWEIRIGPDAVGGGANSLEVLVNGTQRYTNSDITAGGTYAANETGKHGLGCEAGLTLHRWDALEFTAS